ncbi:MBL fold metallo-hydrolase [Cellulomonas carbonis]|nr:MBL fold metallo-hydrolase [Cellulomonas carbonis]
MMTLTSHGHACVSLAGDGGTIVVDPGGWSDLDALAGADAVLVTHDHPDHLAVDRVVAALADRPALELWGPRSVVEALTAAEAPADRVHAAAPGDAWRAAGTSVEALGGEHAVVHPDLPRATNLAYVIGGAVLHPGDSFTAHPGVDVLLVPVGGPWLRVADAVDLVRAVGPRTAVPIHDAVLSDAGRGLADRIVGSLGGAEYRRLAPGESLAVG